MSAIKTAWAAGLQLRRTSVSVAHATLSYWTDASDREAGRDVAVQTPAELHCKVRNLLAELDGVQAYLDNLAEAERERMALGTDQDMPTAHLQ